MTVYRCKYAGQHQDDTPHYIYSHGSHLSCYRMLSSLQGLADKYNHHCPLHTHSDLFKCACMHDTVSESYIRHTNTCIIVSSLYVPFIADTLIGTRSVNTISNTTMIIRKCLVTLTASFINITFVNIYIYIYGACMVALSYLQC